MRPLWRDRQASATKRQAGPSNAQLATHKAWLLQAEIISTVIVSAKTAAARNEIREPCHARRTPKIAGGRNRKKQNQGAGMHRESNEETAARTALAHKVRRETDPTT